MELIRARRRCPGPGVAAIMLFIIISGSVLAEGAAWPGPAFITASSWEALLAAPIAGTPDLTAGFGARAGFFAEGIKPLKGLGAGMAISYAWLNSSGGTIIPAVGAAGEFSFRIPVARIFSLRPKLELGAAYSPSAAGGTWSVDMAAGFSMAFLMGSRNYVVLSPMARWTPSLVNRLTLSLSLGTRTESVWMRQLPMPVPSLAGVPALYSPDGDGTDDDFTVRLDCENIRQVRSWSITILDSQEKVFLSRSGLGIPPVEYTWDGVSDDGRLVDPAADYRFIYSIKDSLGRSSEAESRFTVDILVIKTGNQYKIRVPSILFPSNSADLAGTEWMVSANSKVLNRLVTLFARFPEYSIIVEGHANSLYWQNTASFTAEQKNELVPLSQSRADSVRAALVSLGIASERIQARGVGGSEPIVPFEDAENAWKNRRVEFILKKQ